MKQNQTNTNKIISSSKSQFEVSKAQTSSNISSTKPYIFNHQQILKVKKDQPQNIQEASLNTNKQMTNNYRIVTKKEEGQGLQTQRKQIEQKQVQTENKNQSIPSLRKLTFSNSSSIYQSVLNSSDQKNDQLLRTKSPQVTSKKLINQIVQQNIRYDSLNYYIKDAKDSFQPHNFFKSSHQNIRDHVNHSYQCLQYCNQILQDNQLVFEKPKLNLDRYNEQLPYKKTIIFDVDETLIHCVDNSEYGYDIQLPIRFPNGDITSAFINIRPHCKAVLQELSQLCEVIVFTASKQNYASKIISYLDPRNKIISAQVFRQHCQVLKNGFTVKDLRIFSRDLKDIVLIDNSSSCFGYQIDNGIPIIPFTDDKDDDQLLKLLEFLKKHVLPAEDVRPVLQKQFKLRTYLEYTSGRQAVQNLY